MRETPKFTIKPSTLYQGSDPGDLSALFKINTSGVNIIPLGKNIRYSYRVACLDQFSFADCSYQDEFVAELLDESDKTLIVLPITGDAHLDNAKMEFLSTPSSGTVIQAKGRRRMKVINPRRHFLVVFGQSELKNRLSRMLEHTIHKNIDFHPKLDLESGPGKLLRMFLESAFVGLTCEGGLLQAPLALASVSETLSNLLLEAVPHNFSAQLREPAKSATPRHVKWAIDYMRAHLTEPMTVEEIALAARTNPRTLQQSFQQFRMTTPMTFLRELRLASIHKELIVAGPNGSVSEVALKWGFSHTGRFAIHYKKRFGESPSETLRKSSNFPELE